MTKQPNLPQDCRAFLESFGFTPEEFIRRRLDWDALRAIGKEQEAAKNRLQTAGDYIADRLRTIPAVHSLKVRVKDPGHLMAKLLRKATENPDGKVSTDQITDLIGIRALHLLKNEWAPIHAFVTKTWKLHEKPIAYFRDGDPEPLLEAFRNADCDTRQHDFGYRSVHYILDTQPDKTKILAELQVRTLFEEGWSEIDHRVRYPRQSSDPYLANFLAIFNRLAGSADEMGTFIKEISEYLAETSKSLLDRDARIRTMEGDLKRTISDLEVSDEKKQQLQEQVDQLKASSVSSKSFAAFGLGATGVTGSILAPSASLSRASFDDFVRGLGATGVSVHTSMGPGDVAIRICQKCTSVYGVSGLGDVCPHCGSTPP